MAELRRADASPLRSLTQPRTRSVLVLVGHDGLGIGLLTDIIRSRDLIEMFLVGSGRLFAYCVQAV